MIKWLKKLVKGSDFVVTKKKISVIALDPRAGKSYGEDIAELIALNIAKAAEPEAETEECDEEIDNASKLNIGDIVIRSGDTVVVTEVVNSEIFRYRVIEARDPRTIGAKGGRNVKLVPVRRIRKSGKNKQSEENE